mmetsp:Transcript_47611/g.136966  ORF Transcript_47611/g.136966 Transcript_47611/m.136966 type:complete len:206 (-) Transcript_47611:172-789(-)
MFKNASSSESLDCEVREARLVTVLPRPHRRSLVFARASIPKVTCRGPGTGPFSLSMWHGKLWSSSWGMVACTGCGLMRLKNAEELCVSAHGGSASSCASAANRNRCANPRFCAAFVVVPSSTPHRAPMMPPGVGVGVVWGRAAAAAGPSTTARSMRRAACSQRDEALKSASERAERSAAMAFPMSSSSWQRDLRSPSAIFSMSPW